MCRCLNPDERLFKCDHYADIVERVKAIEEEWEGNKRFPCGICGAMWYGTPVVKEEAHHKIKWRYGIEMEVEFHRLSHDGETEYEDYPRHAAIIANSILGRMTKWGHGGITEDHSLDRGWEVVLPAMSIYKIVKMLSPILQDSHIYPYIRHQANAAFHVTVDPFDTPEQQKAFHDFWNHYELYDDFVSLIGRFEVSYCLRRGRARYKGDGFMVADRLERHYHRCNVRANGAMEVRVFSATYDLGFAAQLQFVDVVNKQVRKGVYDYDTIRDKVKRYFNMG